MKTKPSPPQSPPKEPEKKKGAVQVDLPEREAETLRKFREDLDGGSTLDQTSIRTSLLGRHE